MKTNALYVHIPFCDHICTYCDFPKIFFHEEMVNEYLEALGKELATLPHHVMDTVYIGGGTPSSLDDEQLMKLFDLLHPFIGKETEEVTMEVNHESMDLYKLDILKRGGVNRLSIGVQTFNDQLLKTIGRYHSSAQALRLIRQAHEKGFENLSIDLMYGLPLQTKEDIVKDLSIVSNLPITHLSYYALILEDRTVLHNQNYEPLEEEEEALINDLIDAQLGSFGFHKYEVSNYAKAGYESLHNKAYWHYDNYYGVGMGATSKIDDEIIDHTREINHYIAGQDITVTTKQTKQETMFNQLMMSLRLVEGLDLEVFKKRYDLSVEDVYKEALQKHLDNKDLVIEDNHLKTTPRSLEYLNTILLDFMKD